MSKNLKTGDQKKIEVIPENLSKGTTDLEKEKPPPSFSQRNKSWLYPVYSFLASASLIFYQTCQLERQYLAEKVGKPIIHTVEFVKYPVPRYWRNSTAIADSIKDYYGYPAEIFHPEYSNEGNNEPYLIYRLSLEHKVTEELLNLIGTAHTRKELAFGYMASEIPRDSSGMYIPVKVYTLRIKFKNSGSTSIRVTGHKISRREDIKEEFVIRRDVANKLHLPGTGESQVDFTFWIPISQRLDRVFQLKIEFLYITEYDNQSHQDKSSVTFNPNNLLFSHDDEF